MYYLTKPKKNYEVHMSEREKILRTHYIMNEGIMDWSIQKLKKKLEKENLYEDITLEQAVDWLQSSEMFTNEEIADFVANWERHWKKD